MAKELLLEIGTEEIPAAFLPPAMGDMEDILRREFAELVIAHGDIKTMATPRRLVVSIAGLAERQEDRVIEKLGPATRAAFDSEGNPTAAARGFAKSQGVEVAALERIMTEKGEYVLCRKKIQGEKTKVLLPQILPRFILSLPFKKSMRWADFEVRFARPIHWILAVFGGEVVPFKLENIASGNHSYGHRFLSPAPFKAGSLSEYLDRSRENFVIVDPDERRRLILTGAAEAAASLSGQAFYDEALLDTLVFLVEYPYVVKGSFDESYLSLPREVLTTCMMSQQKYFPVMDDKGRLLPYFLTVSNTRPRDPAVVRRGNEKVIRARLADAKFFFEEDRKVPLEERLKDLRGVVFHTLLGTSYEKVMRIKAFAGEIALHVDPARIDKVFRVATLAKTDLTTQMVGEFPELQGVMGREYALLAGEDREVAQGIYEHYLPTSATGDLPKTEAGAIVAIADKLDSIAGFFGVNLIPTGTADPYALRRQALGVINIILDRGYPFRLDDLIDKSLSILGEKLKRPALEVKTDILAFFQSRLENQLISQGHAYDAVDAVLAPGSSDIVGVVKKISALEVMREDEAFEALTLSFKRIVNIVKDFPGGEVDEGLFESDAEQDLHDAYREVREKAEVLIEKGDYLSALREMARLRLPVDAFFDAVLVMAENKAIRENRLSLLAAISSFFREIADFSKLQT